MPVRIVGGVVLLLAALLHYGYFLADRDQGGPVEAQGEVLACSPEWVYLGLLSSCEVRSPDGVLSVSAARVDEAVPGQRVDLSYSDARGSVHDGWRVAQPAPNYGLAVPAEVLLVGLSAWSLYRGVRPGRGRGELDGFERYLVGFSLGMAVVFGYGAYLLHGWVRQRFAAGGRADRHGGRAKLRAGRVDAGDDLAVRRGGHDQRDRSADSAHVRRFAAESRRRRQAGAGRLRRPR
jgi:hypothetical protein